MAYWLFAIASVSVSGQRVASLALIVAVGLFRLPSDAEGDVEPLRTHQARRMF